VTLAKTEEGHRVLKDRSIALTPRQRTALVIIDGKRSLPEVMEAATAAGVAPDDVRRLVELGLVAERAPAAPAPGKPPARSPAETGKERFLAAYQAAVRLTAEQGLKGVRLNIAVESAANHDQLVALLPRLRIVLKPEGYAELEGL
jgi:hypothetical protein